MTRSEFKVHLLNESGKTKAVDIAAAFSNLLDYIEQKGISGRELAIVKTKLEEACFFAKRGIASLTENQE